MQKNINRNLKLENQSKNFNNEIALHLFDENNPKRTLEKNLHKDLKHIEELLLNEDRAKETTISSSSSLILICLPILKKFKNLKIILIVKKGTEPTELLGITQILRANKLNVRVKYAS